MLLYWLIRRKTASLAPDIHLSGQSMNLTVLSPLNSDIRIILSSLFDTKTALEKSFVTHDGMAFNRLSSIVSKSVICIK